MRWIHIRVLGAACVLTVLSLAPRVAGDSASEKLPIPDAAARAQAHQKVQQTFRNEFAKTSTADREALGHKLLEAAGDDSEDAATRYDLIEQAREVAGLCGDVDLALSAARKLSAVFDVGPNAAQAQALSDLSRHVSKPSTAALIAGRAMELIDGAALEDDWETVKRVTPIAQSSAGISRAPGLASRVDARMRELRSAQAQFDRLRPAFQALKADPDAPAANLEVGEYDCLQKGRWDEGLAMLAKGSDETLKKLAAQDQDVPDDASAQVARGDAWFDATRTRPGPARAIADARAVHWYDLARAGALGLKKVQAEERIAKCQRDLKAYSAQNPVPSEIDPARAEALRWAIETANATPLTPGRITDPVVWSASPNPYRLTGTIHLKSTLTLEPGTEVRGGVIEGEPGGHVIARGLPDRPIIFRQVRFNEDLNCTLTCENCVLDRYEFEKGGVWWAYTSSKWQFTNSLLYGCRFRALKGVDYGFQIEHCALVSMDFPEIAHSRRKNEKFDHMKHLRQDWNRIQSCQFVDCVVPPTVFWCAESSNFDGCRFVPGEAFESDDPLHVVAHVTDTVGESPQLAWAQAPARRAHVDIVGPGKPFPTITLTPQLSVPEVFFANKIAVLMPHVRGSAFGR